MLAIPVFYILAKRVAVVYEEEDAITQRGAVRLAQMFVELLVELYVIV